MPQGLTKMSAHFCEQANNALLFIPEKVSGIPKSFGAKTATVVVVRDSTGEKQCIKTDRNFRYYDEIVPTKPAAFIAGRAEGASWSGTASVHTVAMAVDPIKPDIREPPDSESSERPLLGIIQNSANGIQFIEGANDALEYAEIGDPFTFARCYSNIHNPDAIYVLDKSGNRVGYVTFDKLLAHFVDDGKIKLVGGNITQLTKLSVRKRENLRNRTALLKFLIRLEASESQKVVEEIEKWLIDYAIMSKSPDVPIQEPKYWGVNPLLEKRLLN